MASDEVKTRLTVEGDQAKRELGDVTEAEKRHTQAIDESGRASEQVSPKLNELSKGIGRVKESVLGMVAGWLSFNAIVSTITAGFRDIARSAKESLDAVVELGANLRSLSANVGGKVADEVLGDINKVSLARGFDVEGRNALIGTIASVTDIETDLTPEQIRQRILGFAELQRASNIGGQEAFDTVQAVKQGFKLNFEQAIDQTAVLLNAGIDASTLQNVAYRSGETGGQDFLALLYGARDEVNLRLANRSINPLLSALTRRGADGQVAPELQAVGITEDQDIVQRIATIEHGRATGTISQAQVEAAIGGTEQLRLFNPLTRALPELGQSRADLRNARAEDEILKLQQSQYVEAQERQNQRELRVKLAQEGASLQDFVEGVGDFGTELEVLGGGSKTVGLYHAATYNQYTDGEHIGDQTQRLQKSLNDPFGNPFESGPVIINNNYGHTINGTWIQNKDNPLTSGLDDREVN